MNSHKNARTTYQGRKALIQRIDHEGLIPAAAAAGISLRTARKWLGRWRSEGEAGLMDRSSRPLKTCTKIDPKRHQRILGLRRQRMPMRTIAVRVGCSVATISRILAAAGLSSLKALDPILPVLRYERAQPGNCFISTPKSSGA